MRELVVHFGKIRVFERLESEPLVEYFKRYLDHRAIKYSEQEFQECIVINDEEDTNDNLSALMSEFKSSTSNPEFIVTYKNHLIFELIEHSYYDNSHVQNLTKNSDGTYDYVMSYYDSYANINELLENAYIRLNEK